jgi:hypothetical protein
MAWPRRHVTISSFVRCTWVSHCVTTTPAPIAHGDQGHPTRDASPLSAEEIRIVPEGLRDEESIVDREDRFTAVPLSSRFSR